MSGWRHVGRLEGTDACDECWETRIPVCEPAVPDPATSATFEPGEAVCRCHGMEDCPGDPRPTRCLNCGHPVEVER